MRGQTSLEYLLLTTGIVIVAVTAGYYVASGVSNITSQIQAVDLAKPIVVITYPPKNATLSSTTVTVDFNVSDNNALASITIDCDSDGTPEKTITNPSNPYSGTYTCTYPSPGSYTIKIVARDPTGNTGVATRFFTISSSNPPSCTNQCDPVKYPQCSNKTYYECNDTNNDGCYELISTPVECCDNNDCPSDGWYATSNGYEYRDYYCNTSSFTCEYSVINTCTNECNSSGDTETRCNGAALEQRTCGDYNTADPCLEWSDWNTIESCSTQCVECCTNSDCPPGQVCQNNQCVRSGGGGCTDECNPLDYPKCENNTYYECNDTDNDGCYELISTPVECCDNNDCPSDGWYNYGNNPGCGDDPMAEYRVYYCNSGTCEYNVTQVMDCDSLDECNGVCVKGVYCTFGFCVYGIYYAYKDSYVSSSGTCEFNYGPVVDPDSSKEACDCAGGEWVQMTINPPAYHCCGDDPGEQNSSQCVGGFDPNTCSCINTSCTSDNDCPSDGWYATSNGYEYRDYYCNTSSFTCEYSVINTCTNECNSSGDTETRCNGAALEQRTCGDYNTADPCLEWSDWNTIESCSTQCVECCTDSDCEESFPTEPYCYNHQCVECYFDSHCDDRDGWYGNEYRDYYCDESTFTCEYSVCTNECTLGDIDTQHCTVRCGPQGLWYEIKKCVDDADDDPCTEWEAECVPNCST